MDDLISRQAAIDAINNALLSWSHMDEWRDNKIRKAIVDLPSAERKNGRWINHRNDNGHNIADCSECGSAIQWFDDDEKPKFCCMCGADMRGD